MSPANVIAIHVVVKIEATINVAGHEILALQKGLVLWRLISSLDVSVETRGILAAKTRKLVSWTLLHLLLTACVSFQHFCRSEMLWDGETDGWTDEGRTDACKGLLRTISYINYGQSSPLQHLSMFYTTSSGQQRELIFS